MADGRFFRSGLSSAVQEKKVIGVTHGPKEQMIKMVIMIIIIDVCC